MNEEFRLYRLIYRPCHGLHVPSQSLEKKEASAVEGRITLALCEMTTNLPGEQSYITTVVASGEVAAFNDPDSLWLLKLQDRLSTQVGRLQSKRSEGQQGDQG